MYPRKKGQVSRHHRLSCRHDVITTYQRTWFKSLLQCFFVVDCLLKGIVKNTEGKTERGNLRISDLSKWPCDQARPGQATSGRQVCHPGLPSHQQGPRHIGHFLCFPDPRAGTWMRSRASRTWTSPATPFLICLPANAPGMATKGGPGTSFIPECKTW